MGDLRLVSLFQTDSLRSGEGLVVLQRDVVLFVCRSGRDSPSLSPVEVLRWRGTRRSAEISSDLQFSLSSSLDRLFSLEWIGKLLSYSSVKHCCRVCDFSVALFQLLSLSLSLSLSNEIIRHTSVQSNRHCCLSRKGFSFGEEKPVTKASLD